ncbi:MAG: hypothetical protein ABIY71_10215 [Flavobacteriales bacterium]
MRSAALSIALICGICTAYAQSDKGLPVVYMHRGDTITIGCPGSFTLASDRLESTMAESLNIDQLISQMIPELMVVLPSDAARKHLEMEQSIWLKQRAQQCRKESRSAGRESRDVRLWGCHKWAGTCRLEQLLVRYDELVPDKE